MAVSPSSIHAVIMTAETQSLLSSEHLETPSDYSSFVESHLEDIVGECTVSWHDLQVSVTKSGRELLRGVSGKAAPKQLMALMGASGAGKTTLLNTLLGRNLKGLKIDGKVLVNGNEIGRQITNVSGYAQQEELFVGTLTVKEYLHIQARLRVEGTQERRDRRVKTVLHQLGLVKCQNTRIGVIGVKKGISGGEARRLTFACELLSNPAVLFCDEPTTGLDSFMAESVVGVLSKLAHSGRTIICTIHQPASQIYDMFDTVMFLAGGKTAFLGPPSDAVAFFEMCGFPCPVNYNPADLIIHTLAIVPGHEDECKDRVEEITSKFLGSPHGEKLENELKSIEPMEVPTGRRQVGIWPQFSALLERSTLDNWRNPSLARAKIVQKTVMGLFVGLLYFQTDLMKDAGIDNLNGALFYIVCELTYSTLFGILTFLPGDYPLVVREYHDGLYNISSYFFSRSLSYVPLFTIDGLLLTTISYFMVGFNITFIQIIRCLVIALLIEQSSSAFGVMLSTISPSYPVAVSLAGPLLTLVSLTGGLYANVGQLPAYIGWIQYISWFRYGFEALTINQWSQVDAIPGWNATMEKRTLDKLSFNSSMIYWDMLLMFGFIILFYTIGLIGLTIRVRRSR